MPEEEETARSAVKSMSNLGASADLTGLEELYRSMAKVPNGRWPEIEAAAMRIPECLGHTDNEAMLSTYFEQVMRAGWWEAAAAHAAARPEGEKPWIVLVVGANGIRKTTCVYQPWFKELLGSSLEQSGQPVAAEELPTGQNSFFRQLDFLLTALANQEFLELFQKLQGEAAAEEDAVGRYVQGKQALFARYRTFTEMWGILLIRVAISKGMNVLIETTGKDTVMFGYVNKFFPDESYRKLALHFVVNDLKFADQSIHRRMTKELQDGMDAKDISGAISAIAGGSTYGLESLQSIVERGSKIWEDIVQEREPLTTGWHKADIVINASETEPWTASTGAPGPSFKFEPLT